MTNRDFSILADNLREPLYRIAFHILESESEAEDAVQDLFLKLWKTGILDNIRDPRAYCAGMIKNLCIDRMRARSNLVDRGIPESLPSNDDSDSGVEDSETLMMVMERIRKLPDRERQVLKLRVFDELSYEEISRITGIGYLSLRVILSRARNKLKRVL